jgi:hypothetical protein
MAISSSSNIVQLMSCCIHRVLAALADDFAMDFDLPCALRLGTNMFPLKYSLQVIFRCSSSCLIEISEKSWETLIGNDSPCCNDRSDGA